jgi:cytochrome P450 family 6
MKDICGRFTNDVISLCAFGLETNAIWNPDSEFLKIGQSVFETPTSLVLFRFFCMKFPNLSRRLHFKMHDKPCREFYMRVISEAVDYRERNKIQRNDFLNLLLELKNNAKSPEESITFNELAAQCFIFFLAGFETSSTTMTFALYELAMQPEIQDKLRDKINEAIAENDGKVDYDCLLSIKYLDQVINGGLEQRRWFFALQLISLFLVVETLRKYPPLDFTFRTAATDYKVPGTEFVIPKDTFTMIPMLAIQKDPEYYPDPEKFDPDRFTDENMNKRDPFTFMPFGEGPRICIGLRFGMMQTRIGLISILRHFRISPSAKTPIPMKMRPDSGTLSPLGGMHLMLEKI